MDEPTNATHLGDGAYVSFDGYYIWLWAQRGYNNWHSVALDADAFTNLQTYVDNLAIKSDG